MSEFPRSYIFHCPSQQHLWAVKKRLMNISLITESFCMRVSFKDTIGHVIQSSSPKNWVVNCSPSPSVCDNIWSDEALEAVSSLASASCKSQQPLTLSSHHRLLSTFFYRLSLVLFFTILRWKHRQTSCYTIPTPTICYYGHCRCGLGAKSINVKQCFFTNTCCILLSDFISCIWFYKIF